ncbi:Uncharacterized protein Fot_39498 [Forsythia ovata]|uniref:PilZ domain-containing protein n=1 Tax=Forsythia ovata TaxID=205694 RepID=A0ABD1S4R8_9LAMI
MDGPPANNSAGGTNTPAPKGQEISPATMGAGVFGPPAEVSAAPVNIEMVKRFTKISTSRTDKRQGRQVACPFIGVGTDPPFGWDRVCPPLDGWDGRALGLLQKSALCISPRSREDYYRPRGNFVVVMKFLGARVGILIDVSHQQLNSPLASQLKVNLNPIGQHSVLGMRWADQNGKEAKRWMRIAVERQSGSGTQRGFYGFLPMK